MRLRNLLSYVKSLPLAILVAVVGVAQPAALRAQCDDIDDGSFQGGLAVVDDYQCYHEPLFASCDRLLGEMHGLRPCLEDHGLQLDAELAQFYQGIVSGGAEQKGRFGNKFNLYLNGDTERMGLWSGGQILFHAVEWQFGQDSNNDAVGLAPVNANLLLPTTDPSLAITHLQYTQMLGNGWAATLGRYNLIDLWTQFYPDYGRGLDGFMNVSALIPINALAPTVPPVSSFVGVLKAEQAGPQAGFFVIDSESAPTTVGANFSNGATLLSFVRRNTEVGGLAGSQMLLATYATGKFTSFDTNDWGTVPPGAPTPGTNRGSWFAAFFGEQRLWQDCCDDQRYTKLYGYGGFSDTVNSPFEFTGAISLETMGWSTSRARDRVGIAYFYNALNSDFRNVFDTITPVGDIHGGEVYYNAEITPWFHLTADFQAIHPEIIALDTAIVLALRAKIDF